MTVNEDIELSHSGASAYDDEVGETTHHEEQEELEHKNLARKEERAIKWLRICVFLLLIGVAALIAAFTYSYIRNDQEENFKNEFDSAASKVMQSFLSSMESKVEGLDAMATSYTSYALSTGASWPYVHLPDYEIRAANTRVMSETFLVNAHVLVSDEERSDFEAFYSEKLRSDFAASLEIENAQQDEQDSRLGFPEVEKPEEEGNQQPPNHIQGIGPDGRFAPAQEGSGPYMVWTQSSPINSIDLIGSLMFNVGSNPFVSPAVQRVVDSRQAVLTLSNTYENALKYVADYLIETIVKSQYRHNPAESYLDPTAGVFYPIFDNFDRNSRRVVGMLSGTMYWKYYFKNILPPSMQGLHCVLRNTANQTLTYRIDGADAVFLGSEDLHDPHYDAFGTTVDLASHLMGRRSPETSSYSSVDLDLTFLDYSLTVYPSKDTEDEYINNEPLIFTIIVISVFVFTSTVFVAYDFYVSRRQRIVMNRAIASGTIVSSLFPSHVRDKIYEENERKEHDREGVSEMKVMVKDAPKVSPLADLYENTTVMFADLSGFTQWSSTRAPEQVFELLETIYQEFDRIALRRRVFKIETVGDCYVAVAGLPQPQVYHAVIMTKFARECITKLTSIVNSLSEKLGPDTAELSLRVGLHSGSVTGGVVRGQKSRFQLFGDTMNTASRMESNGERGRIHVSQETADELTRRGKSEWLTPREDKIVAKGKGELQTYWVVPRNKASSYSAQSESEGASSYGYPEYEDVSVAEC